MDYVVIAINPALIMVLIGSLVYFLLEMFYQGKYPERLHFCLTLFIFAAVLIARISMEEGWERAAPFGAALAIAIALAMHQFVTFEGTQWATIGWMINYTLIGIIWWCAIQLTWDCTLIDETQDASGEGLLQTVGLDREASKSADGKSEADNSANEDTKPRPAVAQPGPQKEIDAKTEHQDFADDMGWSTQKRLAKESAKKEVKPAAKSDDGEKSWWGKFLERRRRPHAPGVWVVYFSLAALPIFGFGQAFIPTTNPGSRRYSFVLLCVYVAAGLGLLMTTSFLGLRRYLRQRRLEMPLPMAGTWLATGTVLIAALLVLTMLLPRPNAEYAISQLPPAMGSTEHNSSPVSVGNEGTLDEQAKNASGQRSRPDKELAASDQNQKGSGTGNAGENQSGAPATGKSDQGGGKSGDEKGGESQAGKSESGNGEKGESKGNQASDSGGEKGSTSQNGSQTKQSQNQQQENAGPSKGEAAQSQGETSQPEIPQGPDLSLVSENIAALLKWVFYAVVIGLALVWVWKHWEQVLGWLQEFLNGWRNLWGLLGRREREPKDVVPPTPRHQSFYDYADPFATGAAGQFSPTELVRYSFEAFEAWARDNGWPREADQTAYEFTRQVGAKAEAIAKPARALAELYSRAAYAPGTLPAASVEHLRALWQAMRERQPVGF